MEPDTLIVFKKPPSPAVLFGMPRRDRLIMSIIACRKEIQVLVLNRYANQAMEVLKDSDEARVNEFCVELLSRGGFIQHEDQWLAMNADG